jgi:FkbM family methyltransferase
MLDRLKPVFRGARKLNMKYTCMETWNDKWLIEYFFRGKMNGFFIEAGGADGETESSSCVLEKKYGWRGIIVEPCDEFYEILIKTRESKCIHAALSDVDGTASFVTPRDKSLSGLRDNISSWHRETVFREGHRIQEITTLSLRTLLKGNDCPEIIDFIHLDIEGSERKVLENFPFDEYLVRLFIVEISDEWIIGHMLKNGFLELKNHLNIESPWEKYFVNSKIINIDF